MPAMRSRDRSSSLPRWMGSFWEARPRNRRRLVPQGQFAPLALRHDKPPKTVRLIEHRVPLSRDLIAQAAERREAAQLNRQMSSSRAES